MKPIRWSATFARHYKARIAKDERWRKAFWDTVDGFLYKRQWVGDHALQRTMAGKASFDVAEDCRVVYIGRRERFVQNSRRPFST